MTALIEARLRGTGRRAQASTDGLSGRRVRAAMVNEGASILAEGIVPRALDIDIVLVHGYGYPAWRGGPMFEADEIGTADILADMREVHAAFGLGWEPAPLLVELRRSRPALRRPAGAAAPPAASLTRLDPSGGLITLAIHPGHRPGHDKRGRYGYRRDALRLATAGCPGLRVALGGTAVLTLVAAGLVLWSARPRSIFADMLSAAIAWCL